MTVIFGRLPGTLMFINLCLHFNYSMQKESKLDERGSKMGESEKQNR